jgi:SAM-dependent methyltransferase
MCCCRTCGVAQKAIDDAWLSDIKSIYSKYAIYHQADGAEQPIFTARGPTPRSALIADFIEQYVSPPAGAKVLDFGCGNGAALWTFSARHPDWRLFGSELSDGVFEQLRRLPNFIDLYIGPIESFGEEFDLITMIHALEHVNAPAETLSKLLRVLSDAGQLLIEVPDCETTPYDLVIADHLTHFGLDTLGLVAHRAGFVAHCASASILPKELTWLGGRATSLEAPPEMDAGRGIRRTLAHIEWLTDQASVARTVAQMSTSFGIFGTSISATWLAGAVGDVIDFFVDEDPAKVGRMHLGRPILSPDAVHANADVYVPLIPRTARAVAGRLATRAIHYHSPRDLPA